MSSTSLSLVERTGDLLCLAAQGLMPEVFNANDNSNGNVYGEHNRYTSDETTTATHTESDEDQDEEDEEYGRRDVTKPVVNVKSAVRVSRRVLAVDQAKRSKRTTNMGET